MKVWIKKNWVNASLWILTFISLYIIASAGLRWLPTIGTCANADNVNAVLLNLSYSYLAGGIFYLFTSTLPQYQKKRMFRLFIEKKEEYIIEKLKYSMECVFPGNTKKVLGLNISSVISMFAQTDLTKECYDRVLFEGMTFWNCLMSQRACVLDLIKELLEYKEYMSNDEMCILENIRDCQYFGSVGVFQNDALNEPNNRRSLGNFLWEAWEEALKLKQYRLTK